MTIVINSCFGGFSLSDMAVRKLNLTSEYADISRTDPALIDLIKEYGAKDVGGSYAKLALVDIPDEATDWDINEYDGAESVIYVLDGKIKYA